MKNKKIILLSILILIINPVFAQEAQIKLRHIGYGKTVNEAIFTVHNTGNIIVTDVTFYVDEKEYKTFQSVIEPNAGFETALYLDPGDHLIEVKTPEGAYDSLNLKISSAKEKPVVPEQEEEPSLSINGLSRNTVIYVALGIVIIIIVVVVWLLIRKPKPELEQVQLSSSSQ